MERAAALYGGFAAHAFSIGEAVVPRGVSVTVFHDPGSGPEEVRVWTGGRFNLAAQVGDSLGERMANAFGHVFREGAGHAVIIGTDVPELAPATVLHAYELLAVNDVVIGPTTDGGYYLLGMNAPLKNVFTGIHWGGSAVYESTLCLLSALGLRHALLPILSDIDTEEDYHAFLKRTAGGPNPA